MRAPSAIPLLPAVARFGLWPVPTAVIEFVLDQIVQSIARRHPEILARLGTHVGKAFMLVPTDLPFFIVLTIRPHAPVVLVFRSRDDIRVDATIIGSFAALLGLVHGRYDGDALFFSGDLVIEGDVEAVLALRNAIDNAEIDLLRESAATLGPLAALVEHPMAFAARLVERHTGLALTRSGPARQ
jgi:predicted lipid carrier protein YhbT